ncbi:MAG: S8 family serine peptidase [Dehalococcoidia bacterium]|nr:S8 family serine peptidase [Dehalococcoidia bacterium]
MKSYTMRNSLRFLQVTMALLIALLLPGATSLAVSADDTEEQSSALSDQAATAKENLAASTKLEWQLRVLASGPEATIAGACEPALGREITSAGVRVVVVHGRGDADEVEDLIDSIGGDIEATAKGRTQCVVPTEALSQLAESNEVDFVRLPYHPVEEETSEGVELINADEWQDAGYTGAGVKIGILDTGFNGYSSLLGTELPASVTVSWPSVGAEGTSEHGVACAEIIHDVAPAANLYFASAATDVEWDDAVAWLISQGVDVISCSIGFYITGPRDGTAEVCDAIDDAKAAGIFWAQAAGNLAQKHWLGPWLDTDDDNWLDFDTGPLVNYASFDAEEGDTFWVRIGWDDPWGTAPNDYDLSIYDHDLQNLIVRSWNIQNGSGGDDFPVESVEFTAPGTDTYRIIVEVDSASGNEDIEVFCSHDIDYVVESGSISDNAASPNAVAVGAVDWESPGTLESYSAQGPTVDSDTKPDLVAPDMVSTDSYGTSSFEGTSTAAAHVAAVAALVSEAYPAYDESAIQSYLENEAVDLGDSGKDDLYGYGRVLLPEAPADNDFGDAPDPTYPTLLARNGAYHFVLPDFHLGSGVDTEGNALQNADATGDDTIDSNDDEDGVVFTSLVIPGGTAALTVNASQSGKLDGWVDFNADGDWADDGEQVFSSTSLVAGDNPLNFTVPSSATITTSTFARFRFSSNGGLSYEGPADDGEVEDYRLTIGSYDWGDAPDPDYPTLLASNGARHIITGPYLGAAVDAEDDGQPDADATGDDLDGNDDDDGVTFPSTIVVGEEISLDVYASGTSALDAWIDYNGDGDWDDDDEQVFAARALVAGTNSLTLAIPADASDGETCVRFRLSTSGGLDPTGEASDGEVEDYMITILPPPEYDFGDAPDPAYPTLLASNGARHLMGSGLHLGATIDSEDDGQPNTHATGDDVDAEGDDDDGVTFTSTYTAGEDLHLTVVASDEGHLDAWVDFNNDGDWGDSGEQVFTSESLAAGENLFSFAVPADAQMESPTFARFRFSSAGGLEPTSNAADGEVEDYELSSEQTIELSLSAGWNMVSVPVMASDMSTSLIFADADAVYGWNPNSKSYTMPTTISPEMGYWVAVSEPTVISVRGVSVESWSALQAAGWNMCGSVFGSSVDFSDPEDDPGASVQAFAYAWNPEAKSYTFTQTLEQGKGYWIAATQDCTLSLPTPPGA